VSNFSVCWTKPLHEYGDREKEGFHEAQKADRGHLVAHKRSEGGTADNPVWKHVRTRQEQLAYIRSEGLEDPSEMPSGEMRVSEDGKSVASTMGEPGVWI
jgi:hypothetical protein